VVQAERAERSESRASPAPVERNNIQGAAADAYRPGSSAVTGSDNLRNGLPSDNLGGASPQNGQYIDTTQTGLYPNELSQGGRTGGNGSPVKEAAFTGPSSGDNPKSGVKSLP
jgi:hypothetical protein